MDDWSASTPCLTLAAIAMLMAKAIQDKTAVMADRIIAICHSAVDPQITTRLTSSICLLPRDAQVAIAKIVVRPQAAVAMGVKTMALVKPSLAITCTLLAPPMAPLVSEPLPNPRPEEPPAPGRPISNEKPSDLGEHPVPPGPLSCQLE
jgi:hypothetical protein